MTYVETFQPRAPIFSPAAIIDAFRNWQRVLRERHQLEHLDQHLLEDIGMTVNSAQDEYRRMFWDVPATVVRKAW